MVRLLIASILICAACTAQNTYTFSIEDSKLVIHGTSSIHDWESSVEQGSGNAVLAVDNGKISTLKSLQLTFPVKGIKSGKSLMDSKTYEALREKENPTISLLFKELKSIEESGDSYKIQMVAILRIAGVQKQVTTTSKVKISENGNLISSGQFKMKMTTFNVDPPTAMMGTIKCGDEITIEYSVVFKPT